MMRTLIHADVVELVDTHALGACASRREGEDCQWQSARPEARMRFTSPS